MGERIEGKKEIGSMVDSLAEHGLMTIPDRVLEVCIFAYYLKDLLV